MAVMEPEYTIGNHTLASHGSLSMPHFDEEATLLSARPVVPLHKVKAEARSRRRLVFGLAIMLSLLVGALGATLIYRQSGKTQASTVAETLEPTSYPSPVDGFDLSPGEAGGSALELHQPALSTPEQDDEPAAGQARNGDASAVAKKQASTRLLRGPAQPVRAYEFKQDDADNLREYNREMRRAERREARRLRRTAEREARERAQSSDDLLRIREIFEGSPRP